MEVSYYICFIIGVNTLCIDSAKKYKGNQYHAKLVKRAHRERLKGHFAFFPSITKRYYIQINEDYSTAI